MVPRVQHSAASRAGPSPQVRPEDVSQTSVRWGTPTLGGDSLARKEAIWESLKNSASRNPSVEEPDQRVSAPFLSKLSLLPEL